MLKPAPPVLDAEGIRRRGASSPMPVIAAILMLLSARATRLAPAFAIGWVLGV